MYYKTTCLSPVGKLTLVCDGDKLSGLWIEGQKYFGGSLAGELEEMGDGEGITVLDHAKKWLDRYFSGQKPEISELSLAPDGSEFRRAVWEILCEIPYGEVITYGDIAKKIAVKFNRSSMSGQAVGGAVGHNPVSIIIPCHRVVGANGSLTGYASGIDTKIKLLELEDVDLSSLLVPGTQTVSW